MLWSYQFTFYVEHTSTMLYGPRMTLNVLLICISRAFHGCSTSLSMVACFTCMCQAPHLRIISLHNASPFIIAAHSCQYHNLLCLGRGSGLPFHEWLILAVCCKCRATYLNGTFFGDKDRWGVNQGCVFKIVNNLLRLQYDCGRAWPSNTYMKSDSIVA